MPALHLLATHTSLLQSLQCPPIALGERPQCSQRPPGPAQSQSLGPLCFVSYRGSLSSLLPPHWLLFFPRRTTRPPAKGFFSLQSAPPATPAVPPPSPSQAPMCTCGLTGLSSEVASPVHPFLIPPIWVRFLCYLPSCPHICFL